MLRSEARKGGRGMRLPFLCVVLLAPPLVLVWMMAQHVLSEGKATTTTTVSLLSQILDSQAKLSSRLDTVVELEHAFFARDDRMAARVNRLLLWQNVRIGARPNLTMYDSVPYHSTSKVLPYVAFGLRSVPSAAASSPASPAPREATNPRLS
eukprot:RCo009986